MRPLSVSLTLCCSVLLLQWTSTSSITCEIAYGQRGKRFSNQISWTRTCPGSHYCFEAVTTDVKKMKVLIDYPWDEYYGQYFVRSCGGDLGTPVDYHPWRNFKIHDVLNEVKINITTPKVITGYGGTQELDLKYTCRHDLCAGASKRSAAFKPAASWSILIASVTVLITWLLLY